jgi:hypothetical protein
MFTYPIQRVTRKLSLDFRDRAGRTKTAFTPMEPNRVFPAFCFLWSEKIPTLGHNLALISVLYSGERPENEFSMTRNQRRPKQAKEIKQ